MLGFINTNMPPKSWNSFALLCNGQIEVLCSVLSINIFKGFSQAGTGTKKTVRMTWGLEIQFYEKKKCLMLRKYN